MMKKVLIVFAVLSMISVDAKSQDMTIMDLYTARASSEIDVIFNYLVNNKNFNYLKNYSEKEDKDGWVTEVYIFVKNQNLIKVFIASKLINNKLEYLTQITYKIYTESEYSSFVNTLKDFHFEFYKSFITDENHEVITYVNNKSIKMFAITDMGEYYRVSL